MWRRMHRHLLYAVAFFTLTGFDRGESSRSDFILEPEDSELFPQQRLLLSCKVRKPVEECRWLRGGSAVSLIANERMHLIGSRNNGDCSLEIRRPKIGQDTTFWQCLARLDDQRTLESRPCRVIVRNYTKENVKLKPKGDEQAIYVVTDTNSHGQKKVTVETTYMDNIRIRWFVDGKATNGKDEHLSTNTSDSLLRSTIFIGLTEATKPVLVHCCVEKQLDELSKNVIVNNIYVAPDSYEVNENREDMDYLPFKVKPPIPRMIWINNGKKIPINGNRVVVRTKSHAPPEFTVQCIDESSEPSTFLRWGLIDEEGDGEVTSDYYEYKSVERNKEMISAKVKFIKASRHMTLQCRAENILYTGAEREHKATFTWRKNVCSFLSHAHKETSKSCLTYFILFLILFIHYEHYRD